MKNTGVVALRNHSPPRTNHTNHILPKNECISARGRSCGNLKAKTCQEVGAWGFPPETNPSKLGPPWNWMVGIRSVPSGMELFLGLIVSFPGCIPGYARLVQMKFPFWGGARLLFRGQTCCSFQGKHFLGGGGCPIQKIGSPSWMVKVRLVGLHPEELHRIYRNFSSFWQHPFAKAYLQVR